MLAIVCTLMCSISFATEQCDDMWVESQHARHHEAEGKGDDTDRHHRPMKTKREKEFFYFVIHSRNTYLDCRVEIEENRTAWLTTLTAAAGGYAIIAFEMNLIKNPEPVPQ